MKPKPKPEAKLRPERVRVTMRIEGIELTFENFRRKPKLKKLVRLPKDLGGSE